MIEYVPHRQMTKAEQAEADAWHRGLATMARLFRDQGTDNGHPLLPAIANQATLAPVDMLVRGTYLVWEMPPSYRTRIANNNERVAT